MLVVLGSFLMVTAITTAWGKEGEREAVDLSSYRWRHRLLLIFTPSADVPAYQALVEKLIRERAEVLDRDLIVFHLVDQGQNQVGEAVLSPQGAETLRQRFGVPKNQFRVILIGKDGGVKLSQRSVDLANVFGLIDSMPMRQREMQEKRR
jgi:hypothetical protein